MGGRIRILDKMWQGLKAVLEIIVWLWAILAAIILFLGMNKSRSSEPLRFPGLNFKWTAASSIDVSSQFMTRLSSDFNNKKDSLKNIRDFRYKGKTGYINIYIDPDSNIITIFYDYFLECGCSGNYFNLLHSHLNPANFILDGYYHQNKITLDNYFKIPLNMKGGDTVEGIQEN
jgi:hypothetical protein